MGDALLAAWLAGTAEVADQVPGLRLPGRLPEGVEPPEPPRRPIAGASEGEPVVRFPAVEAAARGLLERQVVTRPEFDALAEDAKRAAFTVARVASLDALEKVQQALAAGVAEGQTLEAFADKVEEALGGSALAPGHVETVFRTNTARAYTQGMMEVLADPLVADEFPYLRYVAVHDARTREEHLAMERLGIGGTDVYRRDDPVWQTFTPPWDFNCRCSVIPLTLEDAAAAGVKEASEWLRSGVPPARPAWVERPPFSPPPGWERQRIEAVV